MKKELTQQQKMAVTNRGGRILVSAAAGSGKTKVLVDRILSYLTDEKDPANLEEFLIITYTKAAASELRGKIAAALSDRIAQEPENRHLQKQMQHLFLTQISTIHGFCAELLREYAYRLEIPADFRVADENECLELRADVMNELLERAYSSQGDPAFLSFVDKQGLGRDDRLLPQIIEQVYDSAMCHKDPDGWLRECISWAQSADTLEAGDTPWGRFLIQELHTFLDSQITALAACAGALEREAGLEKQTANLLDTIHQLQGLREASSWDAVRAKGQVKFDRFVFPTKKNPNPELSDQVKAVRAACKEGLEKRLSSFSDSNMQVLEDLHSCADSTSGLIALVQEFGRNYRAAKKSRRILDFSDLEQKTLDLLLGTFRQTPTSIATEIGRRYREIMVDEYQDSNGVQDAIFMALTEERKNCFLVGDVKQSIYQFRLADPGIFLKKYQEYPQAEKAENQQGRKILLSDNFRSGPEVIQGVNDVFRCCMSPQVGGLFYTGAEELREGVKHTPLDSSGVELIGIDVQEDTYSEEAEFVAARIEQMLRQKVPVRIDGGFRAVEPKDIVILLRSPGSTGYQFQQALEARGIPCNSGSGAELLKTEEVAFFWAFLQIIQNPRQDIPLITALASPVFGFTANELALERGRNKEASFYDALRSQKTPKVRYFLDTLEKLRADARTYTVTALLEECINFTRLDSIYGALPGGTGRIANLHGFFQLAVEFEKGSLRDLPQFLNHLELLSQRSIPVPAAASQGCVTIMSIHKSKGLEFPVVFLSNLSKRFNRQDLSRQILCDKDLGIGLSVADTEQRIRYPSIAKRAIARKLDQELVSEELRVLYVAMTRARDRLIMTYASGSLEKDLKELSLRQNLGGTKLLCTDASCLGDWVLTAALRRVEAGAFHAIGGRPEELEAGAYPWKIQVVQGKPAEEGGASAESSREMVPEGMENRLACSVAFRYNYNAATCAPSKQTATDRKGRNKDEEVIEDSGKIIEKHTWRQPCFTAARPGGKAYGSATHSALQFIRYEKCGSIAQVEEELQYLVDKNFLTEEQRKLVNPEKLARFFSTEIGVKLRGGTAHLREFKFSLLDEGSRYGEGLDGEQVLLQGVVDCALLEEDGITVLDFKTDRVAPEMLEAAVNRYRGQVETYAAALERIFEMPVKKKLLYFFHSDMFAVL